MKEFSNAIKINNKNAEVYILLGNIYRNRGDFEKAVNIHESVIENSDIDTELKKIALINLALDFKTGGFLKRAIDTLDNLLKTDKKHVQALKEKCNILILLQDWINAADTYKKLDKLTKNYRKENFSSIYIEIAKKNLKKSQFFKTKLNFKKSLDIYKYNSYAYAAYGDYYMTKNKSEKALACYETALKYNPLSIIPLRCKLNRMGKDYLSGLDDNLPVNICLKVREFIKKKEYEKGMEYLKNKIIQFPEETVLQTLFFVLNACLSGDISALKKLRKFIKLKFICTSCNIVLSRYTWSCPICKNWLTLEYLK